MTRAELLARADGLAADAKRGPRARGYIDNQPGNIASSGDAVVEELEALRLTLLALFGPIAEVADVALALLRSPEDPS